MWKYDRLHISKSRSITFIDIFSIYCFSVLLSHSVHTLYFPPIISHKMLFGAQIRSLNCYGFSCHVRLFVLVHAPQYLGCHFSVSLLRMILYLLSLAATWFQVRRVLLTFLGRWLLLHKFQYSAPLCPGKASLVANVCISSRCNSHDLKADAGNVWFVSLFSRLFYSYV